MSIRDLRWLLLPSLHAFHEFYIFYYEKIMCKCLEILSIGLLAFRKIQHPTDPVIPNKSFSARDVRS